MKLGIVIAAALVAGGCKQRDEVARTAAREAAVDAAAPAEAAETVARRFVGHLAHGEYAQAIAMLPPDVAKKLTPARLGADWEARVGSGGAAGALSTRSHPADPMYTVVRVELARGTLDVVVGVDDGRIVLTLPGVLYETPDYVDRSAFTEEPWAVGDGAQALPGVLSLPVGDGPHPVVLLEPGAGPNDLDGNDGAAPRHLLRDLAWGLASRGVAVLRHDKRAMRTPSFTVKDEYLDSVDAALAALADAPRIDPARIFVLGHGQAGWLVPWMLRDHPEVRGGIVASGHPRHLAEVAAPLHQYLVGRSEGVTEAELARLAEVDRRKQERARDPALADDTPAVELPLNLPAPYWKSLQGYDALAVIATVDRPLLVLQGGRDYGVTMEDHATWKRALAGKPDVTARDYPALDHHYVAGTGTATPEEMAKGGHAAVQVVDDVATWVKTH